MNIAEQIENLESAISDITKQIVDMKLEMKRHQDEIELELDQMKALKTDIQALYRAIR